MIDYIKNDFDYKIFLNTLPEEPSYKLLNLHFDHFANQKTNFNKISSFHFLIKYITDRDLNSNNVFIDHLLKQLFIALSESSCQIFYSSKINKEIFCDFLRSNEAIKISLFNSTFFIEDSNIQHGINFDIANSL